MSHPTPPNPTTPSARPEEESDLQYLTHLIETSSWHLLSTPSKQPTVLLGRHPKPPSATTAYVCAVYSLAKGGAQTLEIGPEVGGSRREALDRLLEVVERGVGARILREGRRKGEGERVGVRREAGDRDRER